MPLKSPRIVQRAFRRADGHSAVGVAAFVQQLRLRNRQNGVTHDGTVSTRSGRKDVLLASETLGPPDAPAWIMDPEELWNRIDRCTDDRQEPFVRLILFRWPNGLSFAVIREQLRNTGNRIAGLLNVAVTTALYQEAGSVLQKEGVRRYAILLIPTRTLQPAGLSGMDRPSREGFGPTLSKSAALRIKDILVADLAKLGDGEDSSRLRRRISLQAQPRGPGQSSRLIATGRSGPVTSVKGAWIGKEATHSSAT